MRMRSSDIRMPGAGAEVPDVERPEGADILGVTETRRQPLTVVGREGHQHIELLLQVGNFASFSASEEFPTCYPNKSRKSRWIRSSTMTAAPAEASQIPLGPQFHREGDSLTWKPDCSTS